MSQSAKILLLGSMALGACKSEANEKSVPTVSASELLSTEDCPELKSQIEGARKCLAESLGIIAREVWELCPTRTEVAQFCPETQEATVEIMTQAAAKASELRFTDCFVRDRFLGYSLVDKKTGEVLGDGASLASTNNGVINDIATTVLSYGIERVAQEKYRTTDEDRLKPVWALAPKHPVVGCGE